MDSVKLACHGVKVGPYFLPPFCLHAAEAVCLHVPFRSFSGEEKEFIKVLTGTVPIAGLELHGLASWADSVSLAKRRFRFLFREPTVAEWLHQTAGFTRDEALGFTERLGWRADWRVSALAGTHRTLLALELAYARGCEVILFSTSGLDPTGIRTAHELVSSRLARCAAVQFSHTDIHQRRWDCLQDRGDVFPRATCLEVQRAAGLIAPLTTEHPG
jgi:hypothetical protein